MDHIGTRILKTPTADFSDEEIQLIKKLSVALIDTMMRLPVHTVPSIFASTIITYCTERLDTPAEAWDELATQIAAGIQQVLTIKRSEKH